MVRYLWAAPNTALGLVLVLLALGGGRVSVVEGVVEAHGPILRWLLRHLTLLPGGAAAITFGHVVLGVDDEALDATRTHERVHVRQYERWGPFFIPAYLGTGLWLLMRGRHPYLENPFERDAHLRNPSSVQRQNTPQCRSEPVHVSGRDRRGDPVLPCRDLGDPGVSRRHDSAIARLAEPLDE